MAHKVRPALIQVLVILATACTQTTTATPKSLPEDVTVAYPPSLRLMEEALNFCADANPSLALHGFEVPADSLLETNADLQLWIGEPPDSAGFSAPLAVEEVIPIVNPENPVRSLSFEEISDILSGETNEWERFAQLNAGITVWTYPQGNEIHQLVDEELLRGKSITSQAYIAPDPPAMLEAIAGDVGAIGFLPGAWLSDEVKEIELDEGERVNLSRPVLALAAETPEGAARLLLACLQSSAGKEILGQKYSPWIE